LYWAVLSLGPLLAGGGLMFSTYLFSLHFFSNVKDLGMMQPLLYFMPLLLTTATLCLIYSAVPNCRVPLKHAITGALVTAVGFAFLKKIFALAVKHSSYTLIYGAFAAVPLFLMWLYLCWAIVLFGAVLVCSLNAYKQPTNQPQSTRKKKA
jgi:membrane protein